MVDRILEVRAMTPAGGLDGPGEWIAEPMTGFDRENGRPLEKDRARDDREALGFRWTSRVSLRESRLESIRSF